MVEGVFTLDWDKIKTSWNDLGKGLVKTMVEFVKDGKNVGERWGQNVVDSINATMGKAKINSPRPANELEGITVTGTRKDKDSHKKNKKDHSAADRRADKDNLKLQKEARQQLLDQEKYFNDASLRAYKQQLAERQLSQSQFDAIQLSLATAHADRIVSVEKDQLEKIRAMTFKDKKQREAAILEQQRNVEKAENDAYNARTAAYQNFQRNMQQLETGGMNSTEREEQAYQLQLKTLEGYYQASLDYAREHNQSLLAIDEAYQQAKEKLETNHAQRLEQQKLQIRQQYQLTTQSELMKADLDALLRQYDEGLISLDDYYKAREEIERRYEERRQQIRQQYGLTTKAEEYQQQLDQPGSIWTRNSSPPKNTRRPRSSCACRT